MITRALDVNSDWTFGNGIQNYLTLEAAVEQNVVTTVQSWVGDVYWATNFGVDWYNRLAQGQQNFLVQEVKQVVLSCFGVVSVPTIAAQFAAATRVEAIQLTMTTIFLPPNQPASLLIPAATQGT